MRPGSEEAMCNEAAEYIEGLIEGQFTCEVCLAEDIDCVPVGVNGDYIYACYFCIEDAFHTYGYKRAEKLWAMTHPPKPPTLWERIKGWFR